MPSIRKYFTRQWIFALIGLSLTVVATAAQASTDIEKVLEFDRKAEPLARTYEIAYLTQCVSDPYCATNLRGMKDAAEKFHFNIKVFDAQFSPNQQLKDVQNAVAGKFEGYVLAPTAAAQTCSMYKNFLKPTGKPVIVFDIPMCGDLTATPGIAGTVLMQTQAFYDSYVEAGFASCKTTCEAAAVGGYVGTDLFNYWETALAKAAAKYPNVKLVVNQPTDFSPQIAARVIQDGLSAHPHINLIISPSDGMSRGAIQSVRNAGKTPGKDVIIFSIGASTDGVNLVRSGQLEATAITLPYEEGYYAGVLIAMALQGHPLNGYVDESLLPPIKDGPGGVLLTRSNVQTFTPRPRY